MTIENTNKILINNYLYLISFFLFTTFFFIQNYNQWFTDNDTFSYIYFAKEFSKLNFPQSPLYQPGIGLFIMLFSKILNINYFDAFQFINYASILSIIFILIKCYKKYFNVGLKNNLLKIIIDILVIVVFCTLPTLVYISSLLYADALYLFLVFSVLFIVSKWVDKPTFIKSFLLSFLVALGIFVKYNSIVLLGTISLIFLFYNKQMNSFKIKNLAIVFLIPAIYILFWKFYNGNLGGVEFNDYAYTKQFEQKQNSFIKYFKINILDISSYYLSLVLFGIKTSINYKVLLVLFYSSIIFVSFKIFVGYRKKILYFSNFEKVLFFHSFIYICSFIIMFSLGGMVEVEIRTMGFITIIIVLFILKLVLNIKKPYIVISFLIIFCVKNILIIRGKSITLKNNYISKQNNEEAITVIKNLKMTDFELHNSSASAEFNRKQFALIENTTSMLDIPYQNYWLADRKININDSQYILKLENLIKITPHKSVIVIELNNTNSNIVDFLKLRFKFLHCDNDYIIFKGANL